MPVALVLVLSAAIGMGALLGAQRYRSARAARRRREHLIRNLDRVSALAEQVAEQLGWSPITDPFTETTRLFAGTLDGVEVSLAVGCTEFEDWARVELRGRHWLPDGFGVRLPRCGRRELLAPELPNFVTDDHSGLVVEPLETFEDRAAPFGALARALRAADTPRIVPEQFSARVVVRDVGEVVAFLRASLSHAEQWADATAAWQSPR